MLCPHCGAALAPRSLGGVRALGCAVCQGLWLPAAQLASGLQALSAAAGVSADAVTFDRRSTGLRPSSAAACPVCRAPMTFVNYGYDSNVFLEHCPACRAYWAEDAQLSMLASFVKGEERYAPDAKVLAEAARLEAREQAIDEIKTDLRWGAMIWVGAIVPTGTTIPVSRKCGLVWSLIALNVLVYLVQPHTAARAHLFFVVFGLIPGAVRAGQYWRFLTHMFVHAGLLHLGFNMYFLWLFGRNIEDDVGSLRSLGIYLIAGLMGALFFMAMPSNADTTLIGASGAISGLLGAFYARYPRARVRVRTLTWSNPAELPAHFFLGLWFLQNLLSAATGGGGGVAFIAHVGGFVAGYLAVSPKAAEMSGAVAR